MSPSEPRGDGRSPSPDFGRHSFFLALLISLTFLAPGVEAQDLEQTYQAGLQAFQAGQTQQALELLDQVAAAQPNFRDVQVLLGQACLVSGRHLDAKRHFERALQANPDNAHAAFLLGLSLYEAARYFEAEQALERAYGLAPQNPHPLIYRGLALLRLGRADEARAEIESALTRTPNDPLASAALAELEFAAGRLESAEGLAREVLIAAPLGSTPVSLEVTLLLSRILIADGRPAEAAAVLEQAQRAGQRADVLYLLARALLKSGRGEEGRQAMARFKQQKAFEEEIKLLEATLRASPTELEPRVRLVELLLAHHRPRNAQNHLALLRKHHPTDRRISSLLKKLTEQP